MGWLGFKSWRGPPPGPLQISALHSLVPPMLVASPLMAWASPSSFSEQASVQFQAPGLLQGRTDEPEQLLIGLSLFFGVEDLHY